MPLQPRFVIECRTCLERIVLPSRRPEGISPHQPYWPTGESVLRLLCRNCGLLYGYSPEEIRRELVETQDTSQRPSVFWKATLECEHENCRQRFSVHTRTGADVLRGQAGRSILEAIFDEKNTVACPAGHVVRAPRSAQVEGIG
jgi:hypothetical protein